MSRLSQTSSPKFRPERIARASLHGGNNSLSHSIHSVGTAPSSARGLLSENQLSKISRKLANIRQGSESSLYQQEQEGHEDMSESQYMMGSSIGKNTVQSHTIDDFSVKIQEYAIMEDLLYMLMGIDGKYITCIYPKKLRDEEDDPMDDVRSTLEEQTDIWNSVSYTIDPTLDPSLRHLVEKILPLATYYMSVDAFIQEHARFEFGTVNHALASAIRVFTIEYLTFMAQLEHQFQTSVTFTLQKLWFFAQDTMQNMKILYDLANAIRSIPVTPQHDGEDDIDAVIEGLQNENASESIIPEERKGGAILNILSERLIGLSGDPKCKTIYSFLLSKASKPYFEILNAWIYHGEIKDPHNEFMVLEKKGIKKENLKEDFNDTYWETRYTIREGNVPLFLESVKNQILLAGKYLNVVRECGVGIAKPEEMEQEVATIAESPESHKSNSAYFMPTRSEVWAAVDGTRFIKNLEIAYKYANHKLLKVLMQDQQLIGRLRSIKHYFFLDQSDFLTSFLDLAKEELKKPTSSIPQNRLQSLMDLVLRNPSSVAAYDPFKDSVKVSMSHHRLVDQLLSIINVNGVESGIRDPRLEGMDRSHSLSSSIGSSVSLLNGPELSGFEALVLDYTVTFPVSLIISRKALIKYQLLFRHILNMKHVEDLLCDAWMEQKTTVWKKRSSDPQIEQWKFRVYSLRNRMLTFVQQFAYYVTNEVLEPNYRALENNLTNNVSTVDQVLQCHSDFLDTCLKECMLTNSKLLRIFNKLIKPCLLFAGLAEKYTRLLEALEEEQRVGPSGLPEAGLNKVAAKGFKSSCDALTKLEETFAHHMKLLIEALHYHSAAESVEFLCLVVRLDYNQFYDGNLVNERGIRSR